MDLKLITISLVQNVGSCYIHVGKMVFGFINVKSTNTTTTLVLSNMPKPYNDGYIISMVSSYNKEIYTITYIQDHWDLQANGRQIIQDEWIRFPFVYISE